MPNPRKVAIVDELTDKMARMQFAVVADYRGMSVEDLTNLRRRMREVGAEVIVAKNTLLRIAAQSTNSQAIEPLLKGPTSVLFAYDDVANVAKFFNQYSRENPKLQVRGGMLGKSMIQADNLKDVEKIPTREEVYAQIAGAVNAPLTGLVSTINAPVVDVVNILNAVVRDVVGVLQARIDQLQADQPAA